MTDEYAVSIVLNCIHDHPGRDGLGIVGLTGLRVDVVYAAIETLIEAGKVRREWWGVSTRLYAVGR